jgi:hypothetical protein
MISIIPSALSTSCCGNNSKHFAIEHRKYDLFWQEALHLSFMNLQTAAKFAAAAEGSFVMSLC